jgi:hypothetical protein
VKKNLIILLLLIGPIKAYCLISLGSGFTSTTGGRLSPMIYGGYDSPTFALVGSSVGVKTSAYYLSSYSMSALLLNDIGDFWWGKVNAGAGIGLLYSIRSMKDSTYSNTTYDFNYGPCLRVTWEFIPNMYVGVDALFGVPSLSQLIQFSTKQSTSLIFGFKI